MMMLADVKKGCPALFLLTAFLTAFSFAEENAAFREAKTAAEAESLMQTVLAEDVDRRKNSPPADYAELLRFLGSVERAAGKRITELAAVDAEKEKGLMLQIDGCKKMLDSLRLRDKADAKAGAGLPSDAGQQEELLKELGQTLNALAENKKHLPLANTDRYHYFFIPKTDRLGQEFSMPLFRQYLQEAKEWAVRKPASYAPVDPFLRMVSVAAYPPIAGKQPELEAETVKEITAFIDSDQIALPEAEKKTLRENWQGFLLRRPGADIRLYGTTLDDKDFNWQSLRGKIVVVNFTASWCGPCKMVLPALKEAYQKYHEKGLEIVSVYVRDALADSKKAAESEKIPWICLSEELTVKSGMKGQYEKYAVSGVPTLLIAGKDGKVIAALPSSVERGKILHQKLEELFAE